MWGFLNMCNLCRYARFLHAQSHIYVYSNSYYVHKIIIIAHCCQKKGCGMALIMDGNMKNHKNNCIPNDCDELKDVRRLIVYGFGFIIPAICICYTF